MLHVAHTSRTGTGGIYRVTGGCFARRSPAAFACVVRSRATEDRAGTISKDVSPIHPRNTVEYTAVRASVGLTPVTPTHSNIILSETQHLVSTEEGDHARGLVSSGRDRSTLGRESSRRRASLIPRHHDMYTTRVHRARSARSSRGVETLNPLSRCETRTRRGASDVPSARSNSSCPRVHSRSKRARENERARFDVADDVRFAG